MRDPAVIRQVEPLEGLAELHGAIQLVSLLGTDTVGMTRLLDRVEGKGLISRRQP